MDTPQKLLPFFVYGTLIPGQDNDHFWQNAIHTAVPAIFKGGTLYSFGHFPMLVEDDRGSSAVSGMIIHVAPQKYSAVLAAVDALEEYDPEHPHQSFYRRVVREVIDGHGGRHDAWVYVGRSADVVSRPIIPNGSWPAYQDKNPFTKWWRKNGFRLNSSQNSNSGS